MFKVERQSIGVIRTWVRIGVGVGVGVGVEVATVPAIMAGIVLYCSNDLPAMITQSLSISLRVLVRDTIQMEKSLYLVPNAEPI